MIGLRREIGSIGYHNALVRPAKASVIADEL
jgi:hypothetical protein